jgi:hypothetical protein
MKTFQEWLNLKENMYMGRPYGQMGPDGRIYGQSGGPASQVPGTGTWKSYPQNSPSQSGNPYKSDDAGFWMSRSPQERIFWLKNIPNAESLGYHKVLWGDLPPEVQQVASVAMNSDPDR